VKKGLVLDSSGRYRRFKIRSEVTVYTLANCDSCRAAVKWLRAREIPFVERPIRVTPPSESELRRMLTAQKGEIRRLFNTAGRDYREQKIGEKISALSESAALELLAANGNLVKRPFLLGSSVGLVGFDEPEWERALAGKK
jgi:arsenate reductase (glutaredoxin)